MIAASLIGGAVVGAVTVICVLLVNGGQSMTKETSSEKTATSTPQSTASTKSTLKEEGKALNTPTASSVTVPPAIRVRALQVTSEIYRTISVTSKGACGKCELYDA